MKIDQLDKNLIPASIPSDVELEFYNVLSSPFKIYGIFREGDHFARVPSEVSDKIGSVGVSFMRKQTTGGRVSFRTNSKYIVVRVALDELYEKSDSTSFASAGFDIYEENVFRGILYAPYNYPDKYATAKIFPDQKERKLIINLPLFSPISEMEIGLEKGADLEAYEPYDDTLPVVYYGSSITHGAIASRPGNAYPAKIAREIGVDFINLGFGGNAKGEVAMAEYIASLPMSAFVMDYDYNAPSFDYLSSTHEAFYRIIRNKNPNLPIILVSSPDVWFHGTRKMMRTVVMNTYARAMASGDKNIYFVDGATLYQGTDPDFCTVDGIHPNDHGFYQMAMGILPFVKQAIGRKA